MNLYECCCQKKPKKKHNKKNGRRNGRRDRIPGNSAFLASCVKIDHIRIDIASKKAECTYQ
jgi:hypothetical protein